MIEVEAAVDQNLPSGSGASSTVWVAEYCSCCYESDFTIISVNATPKGAWDAFRRHRLAAWEEARERDLFMRSHNRDICRKLGHDYKRDLSEYNEHQSWRIRKIKVNP